MSEMRSRSFTVAVTGRNAAGDKTFQGHLTMVSMSPEKGKAVTIPPGAARGTRTRMSIETRQDLERFGFNEDHQAVYDMIWRYSKEELHPLLERMDAEDWFPETSCAACTKSGCWA